MFRLLLAMSVHQPRFDASDSPSAFSVVAVRYLGKCKCKVWDGDLGLDLDMNLDLGPGADAFLINIGSIVSWKRMAPPPTTSAALHLLQSTYLW